MSSSAGALERVAAPAGWKSRSSTGTSERGVKPPPPPLDGPSSRPPRNCTASATISTLWRLLPSCASHSRHSRRPSSATGRPLARKRAQFSPWAPQTVTSKKLGLSSHSPVDWFLRRVLHATRSEQTDMPLAVERSSGSRVRFPVRTTRLMFVAATVGSFLGEGVLEARRLAESRGGSGRYRGGVADCGTFLTGSLRSRRKLG